MRREPDDPVLDGLALITCAHTDDWEGAKLILACADTSATTAFLARVCADLAEVYVQEDEGFLGRMRQHYTAR